MFGAFELKKSVDSGMVFHSIHEKCMYIIQSNKKFLQLNFSPV